MQPDRETVILLISASSIVILTLVIAVILILFFYQRKQILFQEKLMTVKLNYEKSLLSGQLEVQEQTLEHISREIHDNIGLSLTLAKLNLNAFNDASPERNEKIKESTSLISKAIQDLSSISHSLNTNLIESNGLIKALEEEIKRVNKTGIVAIELKIAGEPLFLDNQKELLLFRIAQEAVNNIIKHAAASKALINLIYSSSQLQIKISDNGNGVSMDNLSNGGTGILNMKARTKLLEGNFNIDSTSLGTTIKITIPIV